MTPYETLQVAETATAEVIKKQYRKLSLQSHPDRKGGSAEVFQRLTEAYEIISDEQARRKYHARDAPREARETTIEIALDQAFTGCAVPFHVGNETYYAEVPAGVDTNEVLVVPRPEGAVRVRVVVHNTTGLVRTGLDLTYTHSITLKEALCGVSFEIPYFQQTLRLSTRGTVITPTYRKILPQKGLRRDKNCGSLTIAFKIEFPVLTAEQIQALDGIL